MIKIKIFRGQPINAVEERVNDFIKDKKVIDIRHTASCEITEHNQFGAPVSQQFYDSVMVIYEGG